MTCYLERSKKEDSLLNLNYKSATLGKEKLIFLISLAQGEYESCLWIGPEINQFPEWFIGDIGSGIYAAGL